MDVKSVSRMERLWNFKKFIWTKKLFDYKKHIIYQLLYRTIITDFGKAANPQVGEFIKY